MERVKDFSKVILRGDSILAEVFAKVSKAGIILDAGVDGRPSIDHLVVISKGKDVDDIEVGDIILNVSGNVIYFKAQGRDFCKFPRYNVELAMHPDNIDLDKEVVKATKMSVQKGDNEYRGK